MFEVYLRPNPPPPDICSFLRGEEAILDWSLGPKETEDVSQQSQEQNKRRDRDNKRMFPFIKPRKCSLDKLVQILSHRSPPDNELTTHRLQALPYFSVEQGPETSVNGVVLRERFLKYREPPKGERRNEKRNVGVHLDQPWEGSVFWSHERYVTDVALVQCLEKQTIVTGILKNVGYKLFSRTFMSTWDIDK